MSLPPFNPRRPQPKVDPGLGDDAACVKCGAVALDTGLECSECGHDNYEAVTGKPLGVLGMDKPGSQPPLVEAVLDAGERLAAASSRQNETNDALAATRKPLEEYRQEFYRAVEALAGTAGVVIPSEGRDG